MLLLGKEDPEGSERKTTTFGIFHQAIHRINI
jgi:hypothetical protein